MSWLFFIFAAMLAGSCAIALAHPLMKPEDGAPDAPRDPDTEFYRRQLRELEQERENGLLTAENFTAARTEIARRLLAADRAAAPAETRPADNRRLAAFLLFGLPLTALVLYLSLGRPDLPGQPLAARDLPAADELRTVLLAEKRLEDAIQRDPGNVRATIALAMMYQQSKRIDEAVRILIRGVKANPESAMLTGLLGQAMVFQDNGFVSTDAEIVFRRALFLEPGQNLSRIYMALTKAQKGDTQTALKEWREIESAAPDGAPWLSVLRSMKEQFEAE